MLLLPFRVEIDWCDAESLNQGGIYYGTTPGDISDAAWRIGLAEATLSFFGSAVDRPPSERTVTMDGAAIPVLFEAGGDAPFDLAAACFYLLSGWQEATARGADEHGRFPYAESVQSRHDLGSVPIVELLRRFTEIELNRRGFQIERKTWSSSDWSFCPTHDVDYLRKWRPGIAYREIIQRGLLNRSSETAATRARRVASAAAGLVLPGDPYRKALLRMRDEVVVRRGKATYFFKTAARGPRDVSYSTSDAFLQRQYLEIRNAGFEIGLHPSYHAYNHGRYLREEYAELAHSSGIRALSARTHYLRFDPKRTPRILSETGFRIDSSVGFADRAGFRRATCLPFPLYDLTADEALDLWEMPLIVMESTLFNREKLDLKGAVNRTRTLMDTCQKHGGVFVGLWHNILWDEQDAPHWGAHFTQSLDLAVDANARIDSLQGALDSWR